MTIPQEAVEAAVKFLPGIPENGEDSRLRRITAQAMLEAALPHIRKQLAEEIRALPNDYPAVLRNIYTRALQDAARTVEGKQ